MQKSKIENIYPLNFNQQTLLIHSLQSDQDQGFLQVNCTLKGNIDLEIFEKALERLFQNHELLRVSIHWEKIKKPVALVHPQVEIPFQYLDWSKKNASEQAQALTELKEKDQALAFNLNKAPLSRISLIQEAPHQYRLIWSCHHILLDGWSSSLLLQDLVQFYDEYFQGHTQTRPKAHYKNYLNWVQNQDTQEAAHFWKEQLLGFENPSLISSKELKKSTEDFDNYQVQLSLDTSEALKDYARKNKVTIGTLLQGLWILTLSKFLKQEDIAYGLTLSGRNAEVENIDRLVGMLVNTLPFRAKLNLEESLPDWLANLQKNLSSVAKYEYLGLDQILDWANFDSVHQLYDSLVIIENFPQSGEKKQALEIRDFSSGLSSTYPLTLAFITEPNLEFVLKYNLNRVHKEEIEYLAHTLKAATELVIQENLSTLNDLQSRLPDFESQRETSIEEESTSSEVLERSDYVPPRNEIELKLTRIWEKALQLNSIGVQDNFFDIGGKSITALRVFSQIREEFGRNLPPITLLEHSTIESLAKLIDDQEAEQAWSALVPLKSRGNKTPLFCLHAGGGQVFFYQGLAKHLDKEQPVYALQRVGMDGLSAAHQSIEEMAAHYLQQMKKVQAEGPYRLLGFCFSNPICIEIANLLKKEGGKVDKLIIVDSPPNYLIKSTRSEKIKRLQGAILNLNFSFFKDAFMHRLVRPFMIRKKILLGKEEDQEKEKVQQVLLNIAKEYDWKTFPGKVFLVQSKEFFSDPYHKDTKPNWEMLAEDGVDHAVVPESEHATLFEEPSVRELANILQHCLDKKE